MRKSGRSLWLNSSVAISSNVKPKAYVRLTDNWIEITVRFIVRDHGIRDVKDTISRDILRGLNESGIGVASGTYQIVGMPPISVKLENTA